MLFFSDSIKSNIKFGKDATDEEVESAAKSAVVQYHRIQETIRDRFRRKRITPEDKKKECLSRAIIKNPPILLFDDCLSAVDTETEETILNNQTKSAKTKQLLL
jgi:ATP-binding cassette subfamily B protein